MAARKIAINSKMNTWKQFIISFPGKATQYSYCGCFSDSTCKQSKHTWRIYETNVVAQFQTIGTVLPQHLLCMGAYSTCQQSNCKELMRRQSQQLLKLQTQLTGSLQVYIYHSLNNYLAIFHSVHSTKSVIKIYVNHAIA